MSIRKAILIGLLLALAGQIAYGQEEGLDQADRVCINSRTVRNFDALDDRHIFIQEGSKKYYLITLRNRCLDLDYAQAIAFADTTTRICSKGFGEVIFRDQMDRRLEKCRIDTIERVGSKNEAKEIVAARKEAKEMAKKGE